MTDGREQTSKVIKVMNIQERQSSGGPPLVPGSIGLFSIKE